MDQYVSTLDALLKDVTGNLAMGDFNKAAGYLKSMSLLAGAMSRSCQQEFELGLVEELEELSPPQDLIDGLATKRQLNEREHALSNLEVSLTSYLVDVSSSCFLDAGAAANALRGVADDVSKLKDTALFPKPLTTEEMRALAEAHGIEFLDDSDLPDARPPSQALNNPA